MNNLDKMWAFGQLIIGAVEDSQTLSGEDKRGYIRAIEELYAEYDAASKKQHRITGEQLAAYRHELSVLITMLIDRGGK